MISRTGRTDNDAVLVVQGGVIPQVDSDGCAETVIVDVSFAVRQIHPFFLQIADGLFRGVDESPVVGSRIAGNVRENRLHSSAFST